MGCRNSSEQTKEVPKETSRGANPTSEIQTTKPAVATSAAPPPKVAPVTLHYFDLYGRGEIFRMIFTHLKVQFTDHRVQFSEWPAVKTSPLCEFGQLPVLEMNGKKLSQTRSVLRYVCQLNGMYPHRSNIKDIYMVESVCDVVDDLRIPLIELTFAKNTEGLATHYDTKIAEGLPRLESRLEKNPIKSGFFVGATVTMADFAVFEFLWDFFLMDGKKEIHESRILQFSNLAQFSQKMKKLSPELAAYLQRRPASWL